MSARIAVILALIPALAFAQEPRPTADEELEYAPDEELGDVELPFGFESGPFDAMLGSVASVKVPDGWLFTGAKGTRAFLEETGNLPSGDELGVLLNPEDDSWILFTFDAVGYVKDDDKNALDPDAMLSSIREGTRRANKELRKRGIPTMSIVGWEKEPHYDPTSHNLEWAPRARTSEGDEVVNYNTRLLGRRGVMEVALIVDPELLESALPSLRSTIQAFQFTKGEDYASFVQGDKVAEYGLAALVTGGAVAMAAKSGLLEKLWKFIVLGVAGVIAAVKRFFGVKTKDESQDEQQV